MRTSNLVLIATVFVFALGSSTLEGQVLARPFLTNSSVYPPAVSAPVYRESAVPRLASNRTGTNYSPYRQWYPYTIARPEDRQWIRETPIELRPNRPLHFWGNSRRRMR